MLSNKVIDYLNKQGVYSEKEDKAYKKALIDLGIDLHFEHNISFNVFFYSIKFSWTTERTGSSTIDSLLV